MPFQSFRPFDRVGLETRIAAWPAGVLRAKGLVYLDDDPGHAYVLQLVGARISLEKGPAWDGARPQTQIFVIGAGLDIAPVWLETSLQLAYL